MKLQIKVSFIIISRLVQNLSVLSIKENYKQIKKGNVLWQILKKSLSIILMN